MMLEYTAHAPHQIKRSILHQSWRQLTYVHWAFDPQVVQQLLPDGLTVHTFEDQAWVGLVPFSLHLKFPGSERMPWLTGFTETNVRTYVMDGTGRKGVWFFSLDADRLHAVVLAQLGYRLPYLWSPSGIEQNGDDIRYQVVRRWPGPVGAAADVKVRIGEPIKSQEVSQLGHFLTARWTLFSQGRRGLRYAHVWHEPWPLYRAELLRLEDDLVQAAGLPPVEGAPHVLYSPGVEVSVGLPHRVE